jgi:predicted nucleic acid-binding protein
MAGACAASSPITIQVSVLLDTDLLSLLERKRIPRKLAAWIARQSDLVVSVVSLAELEFGLQQAPPEHRPALADWLAEMRRNFAPATEHVTEPVLVCWKQLLADLKKRKRTMTCEDSLIAATALFHGHILATHNSRHFEPAGVEIIDPLV